MYVAALWQRRGCNILRERCSTEPNRKPSRSPFYAATSKPLKRKLFLFTFLTLKNQASERHQKQKSTTFTVRLFRVIFYINSWEKLSNKIKSFQVGELREKTLMKILRERRQKRSNLFRGVTIVDGKSKRSFYDSEAFLRNRVFFHSIFKEFSRVERSKKKLKIPEHAWALTNCGRNFVCFLLLIFFQKCQHRHSWSVWRKLKNSFAFKFIPDGALGCPSRQSLVKMGGGTKRWKIKHFLAAKKFPYLTRCDSKAVELLKAVKYVINEGKGPEFYISRLQLRQG